MVQYTFTGRQNAGNQFFIQALLDQRWTNDPKILYWMFLTKRHLLWHMHEQLIFGAWAMLVNTAFNNTINPKMRW